MSAAQRRSTTLRRPSARGLLALMLPVALILHETAYLLARSGQCCAGGELTVPMAVAVAMVVGGAWSLVLVPLVARVRSGRNSVAVPAVIAVALLTIFVSQEAMETLLLGDRPAAAQTALAFLAPLSVVVGAVGAALARLIYRAASAIVAIVAARRPRSRERRSPNRRARAATRASITAAPLAFGLARRPPPALALS